MRTITSQENSSKMNFSVWTIVKQVFHERERERERKGGEIETEEEKRERERKKE